MTDKTLNLFFGRKPSEEFLKDLSSLNKLEENEIFDIIDKILEWYPQDDLKEEVEKWLNKFTKKDREHKKNLLGALLFFF